MTDDTDVTQVNSEGASTTVFDPNVRRDPTGNRHTRIGDNTDLVKRLNITHIVKTHENGYLIYVKNESGRFVSVNILGIEIWNTEDFPKGQPKISISLGGKVNDTFTPQGVNISKHPEFQSPTDPDLHANNVFLFASKRVVDSWTYQDGPVRFKVVHWMSKAERYDIENDIFLLRHHATQEVIAKFPIDEDVSAAPRLIRVGKLPTSWAELKTK